MILKYPLRTEKAVKLIEIENIILFVVERNANKKQIAEEIGRQFNVKVESINTEIRNNKKIAYIKLKKENPAIDIATKLGLM